MLTAAGRISAGRVMAALPAAVIGTLIAASSVIAGSPVWAQVFPAHQPSARALFSMSYDPATKQTILFGGYAGGSGSDLLTETWNWNGTNWVQLHPQTHPSGRALASMAYDRKHGQLLLFGGTNGNKSSRDTWEWSGTNWVRLHPSTRPSARQAAAMAYDEAAHQLILFGGSGNVANASPELSDTWTWTGSTWKQLTPHMHPGARSDASIGYDGTDHDLLLFGGSRFTRDTWVWNGSTWAEQHPSHRPVARIDAQMAWDSSSDALILFGGNPSDNTVTHPVLGDTWRWSGGDWVRVHGAHPDARFGAGLAYVAADRGLMLFGGAGSYSQEFPYAIDDLQTDTWLYTEHPPA